jgi:hypothetical protein
MRLTLARRALRSSWRSGLLLLCLAGCSTGDGSFGSEGRATNLSHPTIRQIMDPQQPVEPLQPEPGDIWEGID